ncbi:hypothetical protein [Staphylococcus intermedius]|uniref:hypothetical protein n=1 Tax=Staphylococcus intermedius TaxID=1285 RepID=UPI0015DB19C2|nr:hypothetical protein [Staphylococcus intermedius]
MNRTIYALKIGVITFLVLCTVRFFWTELDHFFDTILFALIVSVLTVCMSLFLIGKPES